MKLLNTDAIELLCQKLGTTFDKLVPTVIQFGVHNTKISLVISIILIAIGIGFIITGFCIANRNDNISDYKDNRLRGIIYGGTCIIIGLVILIISIASELQAYKTIFRWISVNG